jgi:surfeit locus 1 family protein
MRFRPGVGPTLFVVFALAILFNLGFWQLRRNGEALDRLAEIERRQAAAPVGAADLRADRDLFWHTAEVDGAWSGKPMLMSGRFEFGGIGYDVVQPFTLDGGGTLLVNRGWIPKESWAKILDEIERRPEREHLHGIVIPVEPEPDPGFIRRLIGANHVPEDPIPPSPDGPERFALDAYPGMAKRVPGVLPWVIVLGEPLKDTQSKSDAVWPATGYRLAPKRIPHLQYAVTWFLIAATLIVIWAVRGLRAVEAPATPGPADRP